MNFNINQIEQFLEQYQQLKKEHLESLKKLPSSSIKKSRCSFSLRMFLEEKKVPNNIIEQILMCKLIDGDYRTIKKQEEKWFLVKTSNQSTFLWIKHIKYSTMAEMSRIYNRPIMLKANPRGHNKIVSFDIYNLTSSHTKNFVESVSDAPVDLIETIKHSWLTGIPIKFKSDRSIMGIQINDILNSYPEQKIDKEKIFSQLCESKLKMGYLNNHERAQLNSIGYTLTQINNKIGFIRKPHKPHKPHKPYKQGDERKKSIFTEETHAKLNTYYKRFKDQLEEVLTNDIKEKLINPYTTNKEKKQIYMDKIEQL